MPQGWCGINAKSAARGHIAGEQHHCSQESGDRGKYHRVRWLDVLEKVGQKQYEAEGSRETNSDTDRVLLAEIINNLRLALIHSPSHSHQHEPESRGFHNRAVIDTTRTRS